MTMIDVVSNEALTNLRRALAAVQQPEGHQIAADTWCWIQGYLDFENEHAYLVEVRTAVYNPDMPTLRGWSSCDTEYLAIFEGFNSRGQALLLVANFDVGRSPALADALLWWVRWVTQTREERMGKM
jgi:hypothetical protein